MAKSFADDGAVGAGSLGQSTAPTPGTSPSTPAGSSGVPSGTVPPGLGDTVSSSNFSGAGAMINSPQTSAQAPTQISADQAAAKYGPGVVAPGALGTFFDQGGSVPGGVDEDGDDDSNGGNNQSQQQDPMSSILQRALGSVDKVLQYGYQQYGLSTGSPSDGSGIDEQAANMPAVPGNPSDSGVLRPQPTPGPLPPTSNPFGKRMATNMPAVPGNPSDSGVLRPQPMPGPLPPTNNPFGKRAGIDADGDYDGDQESV